MILWVYSSTKEAIENLNKRWISPKKWDRVVILWWEQTTHEYDWSERKNIFGIYLMWEKWDQWDQGIRWLAGKDWKDGKNWEKGDDWEKWDIGITWEKWEDWISPQVQDIIKSLAQKIFSNENLVSQIKWEKGKDWSDWKNGIDWQDGKDGVNGKDGRNWLNWFDWSMIHVIDIFPENWIWDEKDIVIDYEKNIYCYRNNTIVKI